VLAVSRLVVVLAGAAALLEARPAAALCVINSISGLAFGTYDPLTGAAVDTTISGTYTCTLNASVTISTGSSGVFDPRTMKSGANSINYNMFGDAARTLILGEPPYAPLNAPAAVLSPFVFYARVFASQDPAVGSYSDTVSVSFRETNGTVTNTSVTATVTVVSACQVATAALAFGGYDPVQVNAAVPLDGTGSSTLTCTKGSVPVIAINTGVNASGTQRRVKSPANIFANYDVYQDSGRTVVWGSGASAYTAPAAPSKAARVFTVYGRVTAGQDVPAASYTDTLTVTVNY
jgi:spore coat protein U domain-containing protein, fimbrial subunit CupE1/2/3/6